MMAADEMAYKDDNNGDNDYNDNNAFVTVSAIPYLPFCNCVYLAIATANSDDDSSNSNDASTVT